MSIGNVNQLSFEEICETCKHISIRWERVSKLVSRSVSQDKIGNLFDDFKTENFSNLTKQVEMLRIQGKEKNMLIFLLSMQNHMMSNIVHHYQG